MSFKSFLSFLIIDCLLLALAVALRFILLSGVPVNWNAHIGLLIKAFIFVLFMLVNSLIALVRWLAGPRPGFHAERTPVKLNAEIQWTVGILLAIAIIGAVGAVATEITGADMDAGSNLSAALLLSNTLFAIIYLALFAPLVAFWGLLVTNRDT